MLAFIKVFNLIIFLIFTVCYMYQFIYVLVSLLGKSRRFETKGESKFAVIIAARNEQAVIAQLIASIRSQKYPKELVDVFVVADNCTDATAQVARDAGARVFERENREFVGKGYGAFKPVVGEAVVEHLRPIREESMKLMKDKAYLESVYRTGAEKASYVAEKTLRKVYKKVGFVQR